MRVSLPIKIFDNKSYLQRIAKAGSYAPTYFGPAGRINDTFEQMKAAIGHTIATLSVNIKLRKPFNPILGETLQG